jgi:ABC-2 type transport system permease protein
MRGLKKLTLMELKMFFRDPTGAFFTMIFPLMLILVFGIVYGNEPTPDFGGYGFLDIFTPALTGMIVGISALTNLNTEMAKAREKGILRRLRATAVRPITILTAKITMIFSVTSLSMALMIIVARIAFGLQFNGNPIEVIAAFVLSSFSFFAFGLVIASVMPNVRAAESFGFILLFLMLFLSGVFLPFEVVPDTVQQVAQIFPMTHVTTLMRGLWVGQSMTNHLTEIAVLLGILVAGFLISAKIFRWE